MDNSEENKVWLQSLKVGTKVAICYSSFNSKSYSFGTIDKITPKGAMRVSINNELLFKDGWANGSSSKWNSSWYRIEPITPELLAMLDYKQKLSEIVNFAHWAKLGSPIINQIHTIIKDYIVVK